MCSLCAIILTPVEEVAFARLVELEVAVLVSQPQVIGPADGCLCARACLHHKTADFAFPMHTPYSFGILLLQKRLLKYNITCRFDIC